MSELKHIARPARVEFGPYQFHLAEKRLEHDGERVQLEPRDAELLLALVERPGDVVDKRELLARLWPNASVEDGSLRLRIMKLRRIVGTRADGSEYIQNIPGRGYCFVGLAGATTDETQSDGGEVASESPMPSLSIPLLGRAEEIAKVGTLLRSSRLVSIIGPGGIGKSSVALAAVREIQSHFEQSAFVDLGAVQRPELVLSALCSAVGGPDAAGGLLGLTKAISERQVLLLVDSCEHLIEEAARRLNALLSECRNLHILVTSREPLRVTGEHLFWLAPLACPPMDKRLNATDALRYPAVALLVERAEAAPGPFEFGDSDVQAATDICNRLDGLPLAIELVASRATAFGLVEIAARLKRHMDLPVRGRRDAPLRHQTLQAMLDWSYDLLSDVERRALQALSCFDGNFTLDAARAVLELVESDEYLPDDLVAALVEKSLISGRFGSQNSLRLLDSTRAYAREKAAATGVLDQAQARQARYFVAALTAADFRLTGSQVNMAYGHLTLMLSSLRSSLEWAFSEQGNSSLAIELTAMAAPLFLGLLLIEEGEAWVRAALDRNSISKQPKTIEWRLRAALSLLLRYRDIDAANEALKQAFELTKGTELSRPTVELLFFLMSINLTFDGPLERVRSSIEFAVSLRRQAEQAGDDISEGILNSLLALMYIFSGNYREGERAAYSAVSMWGGNARRNDAADRVIIRRANLGYAHLLALRGKGDKAYSIAVREEQELADATAFERVEFYFSAAPIYGYLGLNEEVARLKDFAIPEGTELPPLYASVALWTDARHLIYTKDFEAVVRLVDRVKHTLTIPKFKTMLAIPEVEALFRIGDTDRALSVYYETIPAARINSCLAPSSEFMRLGGLVWWGKEGPRSRKAEAYFRRAIAVARRSGSPYYELQGAKDYFDFLVQDGRLDQAREVLSRAMQAVIEGRTLPVYQEAVRKLEKLSANTGVSMELETEQG